MRLNHLNLTVPDVPRTREFFETYFGFRCVVERGRDALAVLVDESGFILALSNFDKADKVEYPGAFHIGFMQDSRERVDEIYRRPEVRRVRREATQGIPWGLDVLLPRPGRIPRRGRAPAPAGLRRVARAARERRRSQSAARNGRSSDDVRRREPPPTRSVGGRPRLSDRTPPAG